MKKNKKQNSIKILTKTKRLLRIAKFPAKSQNNKQNLSFGKIDLQTLAKLVVLSHQQEGVEISQRKLQRISYCIQGEHLAHFGQPLFDEQAHAWANGAGYEEIINFPIDELVDKQTSLPSNLNKEQQAFLMHNLDFFVHQSEKLLMFFGYKEQAWNEARKGLPIFAHSEEIISEKMILKSFSKKMNNG